MPAIAGTNVDSVSCGLVRVIHCRLAASGLDRREFCAHTGIREDELAGNGRIDVVRYAKVQDLLRQFLSAGLYEGPHSMATLLDDFPHLASLWCNSPTVAKALQHYCEFRAVLGTPDRLNLQVHGDELEFCYVSERGGQSGAIGCDSAVGNFMLMTSIVDHYREQAHAHLPLRSRVSVQGASRSARAQIEHALNQSCRIEAGGREHRMVLGGAGLWAPAQGFNPALYAHSRRVLESELRELHRVPPLAARVCVVLDTLWAQFTEPESPSGLLHRVAERLHMSRWTLRRQLEAEGFVFQQLVLDHRARRLEELLSDPSLSMLEVSLRLGFDSQSSLSRFVRLRFNETPTLARARVRARATLSAG